MENTSVTVNMSSLQMFLALAFQLWLVVFPIILIRKINYLTALLQEQFSPEQDQP